MKFIAMLEPYKFGKYIYIYIRFSQFSNRFIAGNFICQTPRRNEICLSAHFLIIGFVGQRPLYLLYFDRVTITGFPNILCACLEQLICPAKATTPPLLPMYLIPESRENEAWRRNMLEHWMYALEWSTKMRL